jgi:hypothetical protein
VVRVLRRLGFHVAVIGGSSTGWAEEERLLALDLYLRRGMLDKVDLVWFTVTNIVHCDSGGSCK